MNNGPIPADVCLREPSLGDYGFYRRLDNGKFEFLSFCQPEVVNWLSINEKDLEAILKETLPDDSQEYRDMP